MSHVRVFNALREGVRVLRTLPNRNEVKERFIRLLQEYIDEQIKYAPSHAEIRIYIPVHGGKVVVFKDLAKVCEEDEEVFMWLWMLLQS